MSYYFVKIAIIKIKGIILEEKEIEIETHIWKYILTQKECENNKTKYYINFIYPIKLQVTTESETIFNKLKKGDEKEIIDKWNSAIKAKYNSKLIDSFNTKFKLFVFYKFLADESFDDYFKKEFDEIGKDFVEFKINENLAKVFSSQYYQKDENESVKYEDKYEKTVKAISEKLLDYDKKYEKNYVFNMTTESYHNEYKKKENKDNTLFNFLKQVYFKSNNFPLCDFINLISVPACKYCGITIEQIKELGENGKLHNKRSDTRGYSLEIDRKLPNLEYSKKNCCMSCYWCNNAKTDEFSPKEFKHIAKGINIIWNKRLLKNTKLNDEDYFDEIVKFPNFSEIWQIDYNTKIEES